jgi:hypothetical protein
VYRFWRDLGYAIGAVIAGLLAQALGLSAAVVAGGALTFASALLAAQWITASPSARPAACRTGSYVSGTGSTMMLLGVADAGAVDRSGVRVSASEGRMS